MIDGRNVESVDGNVASYNFWPGVPVVRSSTRIEPVANTSRKSPVSSAR